MFSGWKIDERDREKLWHEFSQIHPDFIGHHITYMFGKDSVLPPEAEVLLVGHCKGDNIECFVAEVNGSIVRPDGGIYHLTWSLDKSKAKPVDSNVAIEKYGFEHFEKPIKIGTKPELFS